MPRYLIERTFKERGALPAPDQPEQVRKSFIQNNALAGVTWIYSYLTPDGKKSFCIYDAPDPEAIRRAALRNQLPVDRISEIDRLDPHLKESP